MKELEAAKKHYSIRGIDDFYSFLNPEDQGCGCRITIEERGEDVRKLTWTGQKPDWRDLRHHVSRCIRWIAMENIRYNKKKHYGRKPPSPMNWSKKMMMMMMNDDNTAGSMDMK